MIREIKAESYHLAKAKPGAGSNLLAMAINDNLRAGYCATINGQGILIWKKGFEDHSVWSIDLPALGKIILDFSRADLGFPLSELPWHFIMDFPEEYHRRPGRNLAEDMEFIDRHTE